METDLQKFLDELRSKISIVDVVSQKVKLTRKGREHLGLCPFHNEKTPSFTVNEAKGFYHCFGCGAHGDIVKFEMEANNLPFMDTLEKLSHRAGISMPKFSKDNSAEQEKRKSLYEIMELAAAFYEKNLYLSVGAKALEYFYARGLDDELIKKFRLGYAPNNNGLKAYLSSKGVNEHDMSELGLISTPEGNSHTAHDFFRDRVMIPIRDKKNQVIAFGGRIMGDGQPKYLNSPETPVFNKRKMLYNINFARDEGYKAKNFIICEGYMDVIALDKFGFSYSAAPMGTALTEDQIMEAWKIVNEPILCFDGDNAGQKAALRSVERALPILKAGYSLRFMFLPDKMDPDEFLKAKGKDEFLNLMQNTTPLMQLLWDKNTKDKASSTPEQKALIEKTLMEEVANIKDEKVKSYYLQEMQKRIYETYGRGTLRAYSAKSGNYRKKSSSIKPPLTDIDIRFILASMIVYPELIGDFEEKLLMFDITKFKLYNMLQYAVDIFHEDTDITSESLIKSLKTNFEKDFGSLWEVGMLKSQNPRINEIKRQIDCLMIAVQIKELNKDINEYRIKLEKDSATDEDYQHYLSLISERDILIKESNAM
ncbi:MAG: DNA primase, partial [Alphaproteobacteria bacterium]|nr:DNA primase [Alphaproteobacteria bacterium]MBQ2810959.1 DNA primase [Alphaproteobacteria bacterium]